MTNTLVITHSADHDGLASQAIAQKALGKTNVTYLGFDYGDDVPDLAPYTTIYLIDISLPKDVMIANAEKLIVIDHHKTLIDDLPTYVTGTRMIGVSAARLAYQWFFGDRKATLDDYLTHKVTEPYAIQLIGEYDVWLKDNPDTDPFQYGLSAEASPNWDLLLSCMNPMIDTARFSGQDGARYIDRLIKNGRVILSYLAVTNAQIANKSGFDVDWEGLKFRALNTATKGSMQFDSSIADYHDGMLKYNWNGEAWDVSLYGVKHKPDIDLSVIAKKHGGGGHRSACGLRLKELPKELGGVTPQATPVSTLAAGYYTNPLHPNPEKLPEILDVGKRIRVKEGRTWAGWTGTIRAHYISGDDCGPRWGRQEYAIDNDKPNQNFSISPDDVEFI